MNTVGEISCEQCTGCKMCKDICPKNAISFVVNEEGFWYPVVDKNKCINCNLCVKKCPSLNSYKMLNSNDKPEVYAVWSNNDETRITSTSGGAFWEFASYFIGQGGVVAGCVYEKDWKSAKHMIAYSMEELQCLKGSKYFQSDTDGIYNAVKKVVLDGKLTLFCGTPCQNAALRSYLAKDYDNLYYMDFICRSINSPLAFCKYLEELEQRHNSKVIGVHLKNKKYGWQSLASQVKFANGDEEINDKNSDWWVRGFIYNDLFTRDSCYNCKYKTLPRFSADISIGDFWGIKNQTEESMFKGISVLLLNTDRGRKLFEESKQQFCSQKYTIEDVLPGNPALLYNPIKTSKQDRFFKLIQKYSFSYSVSKCIEIPLWKKGMHFLIRILKKIKTLLRMIFKNNVSISKYVYYNYCCKNVIRDRNCKIIPHRGSIINFAEESKIYLHGGNLEIGFNQLKGSKSETHIRLDQGAVWKCNNGGLLFYNTVVEVKTNAVFESGFFSANGGSVIIAHHYIKFGEDVMIGRNVIIYDSDFHSIIGRDGKAKNYPKEVIIEDHVWLTSNITVLKGVTIGSGSLVTAQTVVNKDVPSNSIVGGGASGKVIKDYVKWDRTMCPVDSSELG